MKDNVSETILWFLAVSYTFSSKSPSTLVQRMLHCCMICMITEFSI